MQFHQSPYRIPGGRRGQIRRILVPRADAESIAGSITRGPASGGWELDGKASTYLTTDGLVVSPALDQHRRVQSRAI